MREHVVAASKAMRNGDWKKARDYIINDKMNGKVGDFRKPLFKNKIKYVV
jgi:translation initiation factor 3 subunit C